MAKTPPTKKRAANAGGAAGAAGYSYQGLVGARIAVRLLSETDVSSLLGTVSGAFASLIRFETEQPVDDILVQTTAGRVLIQVKTTLSLSGRSDLTLASVLGQFARQWLRPQTSSQERVASLVLMVSDEAPKSVTSTLANAFNRVRTASSIKDLEFGGTESPTAGRLGHRHRTRPRSLQASCRFRVG